MSDDLLKAADEVTEWVGTTGKTHWDKCYRDHRNCLIAALAARVRELEAERSAMIDNVRFARERAERAEAERDALRALLREARERETRYVLPLYRDANYTARIDAALAGEKP